MAKIQFDIIKTDGGQSSLLKDPNCQSGLWVDERETILARIGSTKGRPETGLKVYSVSYSSDTEGVIRCIEIINSIDAREKSNITISIKVPAQFNRRGEQILSVFDAINNDVKSHLSSPSVGLMSHLEYTESNSRWNRCSQNGKFGVKTFANQNELVELLDNILQPDYHNYQAVYFIPQDCKFYEDSNYVLLKNPIDKQVFPEFKPQTPIPNVEFVPVLPSAPIFESQLSSLPIKWECPGYKTIVKCGTSMILPHEVYVKVNKSAYLNVTPQDSQIECSDALVEGDIMYLPPEKLYSSEFKIFKDGYETTVVTLSSKRQNIVLKEKSKTVRVPYYTSAGVAQIDISFTPSSTREVHSPLILCTKNYLSVYEKSVIDDCLSFKSLLHNKWVILVFCAGILLGGLIGVVGTKLFWPTEEIVDRTSNKVESAVVVIKDEVKGEDESAKIINQEMIENYLAASTWRKNKCSDKYERDMKFKTKEPDGLWDAMNTYDYKKICSIYEDLKSKGYKCGKLEEIYKFINSQNPKDMKGKVHCEGGIRVETWISNVSPSKPQASSGTGSTSSAATTGIAND